MFWETLEKKLGTGGYKLTGTEETRLDFSPGIKPEDIEIIGRNAGYKPGALPSTSYGTRKTFARTRAEPELTMDDIVTVYYAEEALPDGESTIYHLAADRKQVFSATGESAFEARLRTTKSVNLPATTFEGVSKITVPIVQALPVLMLDTKRPVNPASPYLAPNLRSVADGLVDHTLNELKILEGQSALTAGKIERNLEGLWGG